MPNDIPDKQNGETQLERLAAQRQLYSRAKSISAIQLLITALITTGWAFLGLAFPHLRAWAVLLGTAAALLDILVFDAFQRHYKTNAAKTQELFDCDVLQLPWNTIKAGSPPDPEYIKEAAQAYKRNKSKLPTLRNWYPDCVRSLAIEQGRLICQRVNCWWDSDIRHSYARWLTAVYIAIGIAALAGILIATLDAERIFLGVVAPLAPLYYWGIRECINQRRAANREEELKKHVILLYDSAAENAIAPGELTNESRKLQDELYALRQSNPLIFDWLYKLWRQEQNHQMDAAAKELVSKMPPSAKL